MHVFESAGLGIAPFKLVRVEMRRYKACADCPSQPGASCQYCGEGIVQTCIISDVNGKEFHVGNVCVNKTSDRGLIDPIKRELNRLRTEERHAKMDTRIANARACLISDEALRATLSALPHPYTYHNEQGKTLLDSVEWMLQFAGRAGMVEACKVIEKYATRKMDEFEIIEALAERERQAEARRAEVEAEATRQAEEDKSRREAVKAGNAWLTDTLTGNGGFVESMRRELSRGLLAELNLSEKQMDILSDIYGKSAGRYNSKSYWSAVDYFEKMAGRDE
jgi:hypothetical protein